MISDHKNLLGIVCFDIEVVFLGIVYLVSSVFLLEPLNVQIDDDLGIWLFWQVFSSIASNNYHLSQLTRSCRYTRSIYTAPCHTMFQV